MRITVRRLARGGFVEVRRSAEEEAKRDALLASDEERDQVAEVLSDALAHGRLTSAEFEERTDRALRARTHGELEGVLQGLHRLAPDHLGRRVVFWLAAIVASPFALLGALAVPFGVDSGDRWGGLVLLVMFVPPLYPLHRWAWPRHQRPERRFSRHRL